MKNEVVIIVTEDDEGHAKLIQKNLARAGIANEILRFSSGEETLDFLFRQGAGPHRRTGVAYLLLLDIRMPGIDGIEVLRRIKAEEELRALPIIMITTSDDPREVELCHRLGCSCFIVKPVDAEKFVNAIRQLGLFLTIIQLPALTE